VAPSGLRSSGRPRGPRQGSLRPGQPRLWGYHGPFFTELTKGDYRAEGLDVEIVCSISDALDGSGADAGRARSPQGPTMPPLH